MSNTYNYIKKYFLSNNPVLTSFLIIFPAVISSYSFILGFYFAIILTFMLIITKMFFLITSRCSNKIIALNINTLFIATYITLIFLISNILYLNQIRILIPSSILLISNYIITDKLGISSKNDKLVFCLLDGLIFFLISLVYVLIIGITSIFFASLSTSDFSVLYFALTTLLLNFIRLKFETFLEKKEIKKI